MSRIVGDALVAGPEATSAPEYVTVRITRGQAEALTASAVDTLERLYYDGHISAADYLNESLSSLLRQIGGPR